MQMQIFQQYTELKRSTTDEYFLLLIFTNAKMPKMQTCERLEKHPH